MYVLDSNTVSYMLRGEGRVAERLVSVPPDQVGLPSIVLFEIEYGLAKLDRKTRKGKAFRAFYETAVLLPFGREEAGISATIRAELARKGTPIGAYDLLIAGTCVAAGGILVTHNTREFRRVPGLRVEDWY